jgi:hypothetical protein
MDSKLFVHESMGQRYTPIPQNRIYGTEELKNLPEILALIEATLDEMYIREKLLESELVP